MTHRVRTIAIVIAAILSSVSLAFSQDDATKKIIQDIERSEKLRGNKTAEEKKLQFGMYELLRDAEAADTSAKIRQRFKERLRLDDELKTDSQDRVKVEIGVKSAADVKSVVELIESLDGVIIQAGKYIGFVICKIHPKKLRALASSSLIVAISPNVEGHTRSIVSAGDVQLKADSARAQFMVSGFGVKVGVISDGVDNLDDVRNNFELPSVTVLNSGNGNEGTAILEIVHDLAPDANLYFYSGNGGYVGFADGVKSLKANGCKIIIDDLGYFNEPYFTDEDDTLGAAIRDFINNGGTFVSAAGNDNHSLYNDPNGYSVYSGQTNIGAGNLLVFPNGWAFMDCWVNANTAQFIFFQWATSWKYPASDYDLYIYDDSGTKIDSSQIVQSQNGPNPPFERVRIGNNTSSAQHYKIVIKFVAGSSSNTDFKITCLSWRGKLENSYTDNKHTYGHPCYPGVIGTAAYDAELYDQLAVYSSGGPITMFSTVANQWFTQLTPIITATSGVATWVGTNPPGNPYWPSGDPLFYGTSAAAPHVAAIAALYFEEFPTRTRNNFIADIENSAFSIEGKAGNGSWDSRAGYGKANALACLKLAESGGVPPPPPPGTAYVAITNVQDTVIQTGQSIVTTTVTYTRQRKWPSAVSPCVWWIEIWIDNARATQVEPPQSDPGNTFSFSYSFGYGNHNIKIVQNETDPSFCLGWSTTASTIRTINVIYAPVLVTLDQKTQDSARVGTLGLWNGSSFNPRFAPPMSFTFPCFSAQLVHGDTNVYQGQKYNYWSIIRVPMPDVTNHHSFTIGRLTRELISNFAFTKKATLQAQLIEGGNPGGSVDFKDPWLIDSVDQSHGGAKMNRGIANAVFRRVNYDASKPNLDTSTNYKGMFLNQRWDVSNPVYYSVRAPLTQTITVNGLSFPGSFFQGWTKSGATLADSTNSTTAVVFNSSGATVTAKYKAHLGSSVSTATAGGGRKIVKYFQEFDGYNIETYYAVYPSAGSIWFTHTGAEGWTPEVKLGDGINPSIAITGSGELRVVWEKEPVSGQRIVYYRRSGNDGTSWDAPITIATTSQTYDATPVPLTSQNMRALWRGANGLYASIYITSPPQWIQSGLSAGLNSIAQSPSISTIKIGSDTSFGLVCQDTNKIKYCKIFYTPAYVGVSDMKEISTPGTTGNINPTIAFYNGGGNGVVAWENINTHKVYARSTTDKGSTWSAVYEFSHGTDQLSKPTVGFDNSANNWIFCQSQPTAGDVHVVGSYNFHTMMADMGTGSVPNLSESSEIECVALSTKGAEAPFTINPIITPQISPWSGNIDYDATWGGLNYVTGTVTVNAGVTLTITAGSVITFASGTQLIVNGTLNAIGTSSQRITFDCSSSPGTWGGIRFNAGSSGIVSYSDINHAVYGIYCTGASPAISNNTITNCSADGIYLYNAAPSIKWNTISNNTGSGVYSHGSPSYVYLYRNTITGNQGAGINAYDSDLWLSQPGGSGYNAIRQNNQGITAAYNSCVYLVGMGGPNSAYNCVHNNTGLEVTAAYNSTVQAPKTFWNRPSPYTPWQSDYSLYYSTFTYSNPLSSDPNPGCPSLPQNLIIAGTSGEIAGSPMQKIEGELSSQTASEEDDLFPVVQLEIEGKYTEAIAQATLLWTNELQQAASTSQEEIVKRQARKWRILTCLASCYRAAGRKDFVDFLNKEIRPKLSIYDELYAATLELEGRSLVNEGKYKKAIENWDILKIRFAKKASVHSYALYNLAYIYYDVLGDKTKAGEYFEELKAKYPDDEMTWHCRVLFGETDSLNYHKGTALQKEAFAEAYLPEEFGISQNYPNPFNPATTICYQLPGAGTRYIVSLKVYDLLGREVANLVNGIKEAGYHTATFDGSRLASGIYFTRFVVQPENETRPFVQVKKMLLMK